MRLPLLDLASDTPGPTVPDNVFVDENGDYLLDEDGAYLVDGET